MGSYEEWRSSTKLAPYSLTSRYWTFSCRYEKTHYICKTEHYTGTGSSLKFLCPWWWCVFLAKWLCNDMHVYLQAITKRFKQVYRKTIKIVCGCGLESLYFRSGYRNRSVIGSKKYQCKAVKCHLFTWGIISFCNFPLSEKSGYLCIARTGDMESSNDWYASNVEVDAIWYYEQECDGCLKVKETRRHDMKG